MRFLSALLIVILVCSEVFAGEPQRTTPGPTDTDIVIWEHLRPVFANKEVVYFLTNSSDDSERQVTDLFLMANESGFLTPKKKNNPDMSFSEKMENYKLSDLLGALPEKIKPKEEKVINKDKEKDDLARFLGCSNYSKEKGSIKKAVGKSAVILGVSKKEVESLLVKMALAEKTFRFWIKNSKVECFVSKNDLAEAYRSFPLQAIEVYYVVKRGRNNAVAIVNDLTEHSWVRLADIEIDVKKTYAHELTPELGKLVLALKQQEMDVGLVNAGNSLYYVIQQKEISFTEAQTELGKRLEVKKRKEVLDGLLEKLRGKRSVVLPERPNVTIRISRALENDLETDCFNEDEVKYSN